jgi:hypothetical protein
VRSWRNVRSSRSEARRYFRRCGQKVAADYTKGQNFDEVVWAGRGQGDSRALDRGDTLGMVYADKSVHDNLGNYRKKKLVDQPRARQGRRGATANPPSQIRVPKSLKRTRRRRTRTPREGASQPRERRGRACARPRFSLSGAAQLRRDDSGTPGQRTAGQRGRRLAGRGVTPAFGPLRNQRSSRERHVRAGRRGADQRLEHAPPGRGCPGHLKNLARPGGAETPASSPKRGRFRTVGADEGCQYLAHDSDDSRLRSCHWILRSDHAA